MSKGRFVGVGSFRWKRSHSPMRRRVPQEAWALSVHVATIEDLKVRKEVADALVESLKLQYANMNVKRFLRACKVEEN